MSDDTGPVRPTLEELDATTCLELVASTPVGRLGFIQDNAPVVLPVNHLVDDGDVVFRTAVGSKLDVAQRESGPRVVYEVDSYDPADHSGWSVLVKGHLEPVLNRVEAARLDRRRHRVWVDDPERQRWVRVRATEITGRRIVTPG